ncbi:hypothetical protein CSIRO_3433 [Bradyrhizobiaceae bacterium SG-6C]|nr:hypothetical protein CSIRO_3433 [Bradyrhizobiaceae bacterium SG-6C]
MQPERVSIAGSGIALQRTFSGQERPKKNGNVLSAAGFAATQEV